MYSLIMEPKYFKPKWTISKSRGRPMYISSKELLVAHDFFIKAYSVSGSPVAKILTMLPIAYHSERPQFEIERISTSPELGMMAVSARTENCQILIFKYPSMQPAANLCAVDGNAPSDMVFLGSTFLLSVHFKPGYHFCLWNTSGGNCLYDLSTLSMDTEVPKLNSRVNPLCWSQAVVQSNVRLFLLEVKSSGEGHYRLEKGYYVIEDLGGKVNLRRVGKSEVHQDSDDPSLTSPYISLQCFCWWSGNKVIVATSDGIFEAGLADLTLQKLKDHQVAVVAMDRSGSSLYAVYETGAVDVVDLDQNAWNVRVTIGAGQPVNYAVLSPDCKYVTVTTPEECIINLEITASGQRNAIKISDPQFGEIVGVGLLGPLSSPCVVAEKNGALHIIDDINGSVISTFKIEEAISSLATSPLCSCAVVGSSVGFLYFIDCTRQEKPRMILCERPFDAPITRLKFDNFGRYVVASAHNQGMKIWNSVPSTNFLFLGSMKWSAVVKDFDVFSRTFKDNTFVLVLTEDESGQGVIARLQLPNDFSSCFKKYQMDSFGTLSTKALNIELLRLDHPFTSIEVHWKSGILFQSPSISYIQSWTDFETDQKVVLTNLKRLEGETSCCVSLNQQWLATVGKHGCIKLYNMANAQMRDNGDSSKKLVTPQRTDLRYLEFSLFANSLLCGSGDGRILYYEWNDHFLWVPEWVVHCFMESEAENSCLKSMDEEEKADLLPQNDSDIHKEFETFKASVCVINSKLSVHDSDAELLSKIILDEDLVSELSVRNRRSLSEIMPQSVPEDVRASLGETLKDDVESMSSINVRVTVENYSDSSIDRDNRQADSLRFGGPGKTVPTPRIACSSNLRRSVKSKCNEERLSAIQKLLWDVCDIKKEFNAEFDAVHSKRQAISNSVEQSYLNARMLSQSLPSKAERDFWTASIESPTTLLETDKNEQGSTNGDVIAETKQSILDKLRSSSEVQKPFDGSIDGLRLRRRFCDFSILGCELKIYVMLLFTAMEDDFSNWKGVYEIQSKSCETFEIFSLREELSRLLANMEDKLSVWQKHELGLSKKMEDKCRKDLPEKVLQLLKAQVGLRLDRYVQGHGSSASIESDGVFSVLKDFASEIQFPHKLSKPQRESVCFKQSTALALGILTWHLKNQLCAVRDAKQMSHDFCLKAEEYAAILKHSLRFLSYLVSACTFKFQSVLFTLEKTTSFDEDEVTCKRRAFLNASQAQGHKLWADMDQKTSEMLSMKQQVKDIEHIFDCIRKSVSDISEKCQSLKEEHSKLVDVVKESLEGARQAFKTTESIYEDYVDKRMNNLVKILKALF